MVDVGGGIGSTTMVIWDAHKHLRYIVQDRDAVTKDGIEVSEIYTHDVPETYFASL